MTLRKSISRAKNEKAVDDLAVRIKRSKTLQYQSVLIIAVEKIKKVLFQNPHDAATLIGDAGLRLQRILP